MFTQPMCKFTEIFEYIYTYKCVAVDANFTDIFE
jgi:hypothetical protein